MNLKSRRRYDALKCISALRLQHPEVAAKAAAKMAFDAVDAAIAEVELLASGRLHSTNTFLSASAERQTVRAELHDLISDLSRISKTLPRGLYPDIAEQLRMGRLNAYHDLLSLARNATVVITPMKQVFIDHGAPETVTEDIQSLIDALELAANRRNRGMGSQIATNTSLRIAARNAMDQVRILDGILTITLKRQPGLLAEWKSAMRLRRRGKSTPSTAAPEAPISISAAQPTGQSEQPNDPAVNESTTMKASSSIAITQSSPPFADSERADVHADVKASTAEPAQVSLKGTASSAAKLIRM